MSTFDKYMNRWVKAEAPKKTGKVYRRDERIIQDEIAKRLRDAGYLVVQMNSGMHTTDAGVPMWNYFIWNNKKHSGLSDLTASKNGQTWFLEVKKPGGRQSESQKQFEEVCNKTGNIYRIVRGVQDVEDLL